MMKKIYLAGRFLRMVELRKYAETLRSLGHEVTSNWLKEDPEHTMDKLSVERMAELATIDIDDVKAADTVIFFGETKEVGYNSGGRHVEFGVALALGKKIAIVGHCENIFHYLDEVSYYISFDELIECWGRQS